MRWFRVRVGTPVRTAGTGRGAWPAVGVGLLMALGVGCAGGAASPPASPAAPGPLPASTNPPPAAPPAVTVPAAADGADVASCRDGTCEIEVATPTDVPLSAFGIQRWRVGPSGPDGITFDLRPRGGDIDTGPRGALSGTSSDASTSGTVSGRGATISKRGVVMTVVAGDGGRTVLRFARG